MPSAAVRESSSACVSGWQGEEGRNVKVVSGGSNTNECLHLVSALMIIIVVLKLAFGLLVCE